MALLSLLLSLSLLQANTGLYPRQPDAILKIWPGDIPNTVPDHGVEAEMAIRERDGMLIASKVVDPEMLVLKPVPGTANGSAVLIFPGGGYRVHAMGHEGFEYAQFLNDLGFVAIIVRYRLPEEGTMVEPSIGPLMDALEAIRITRRRAPDWGLDPGRIGVMGSSAGGHLAGTASTCYDWPLPTANPEFSARPDFSILVYPVIDLAGQYTHQGSRKRLFPESTDREKWQALSPQLNVDANTPPAFLIHSADDGAVPYQNSAIYYEALTAAGVAAECHLYPAGGHGYGMSKPGAPPGWPDALRHWLVKYGAKPK